MDKHVVIGIDCSVVIDGLVGLAENLRGDPAREFTRELRRRYVHV
jgi:hypothetical protein